jgi:hypothetical protein
MAHGARHTLDTTSTVAQQSAQHRAFSQRQSTYGPYSTILLSCIPFQQMTSGSQQVKILLFALLFVFEARLTIGWVLLQQNLPERGCRLGLETEPLIGGPSWLKLHVKVVLEFDGHAKDDPERNDLIRHPLTATQRRYKFDFIPLKAAEPETLRGLLLLQWVPAELRYFSPADSEVAVDEVEQLVVQEARLFCNTYRGRKNLHLLFMNCWTFAFALYNHILQKTESSDSSAEVAR